MADRLGRATAEVVERLATQVLDMRERLAVLEALDAERATRIDGLFDELSRAGEVERWRTWCVDVVAWSERAAATVRHLGGDIPAPPVPPS